VNAPQYEFSIDVGGTFTDCIEHSSSTIKRHKLLSSGRTLGKIEKIAAKAIHDPLRVDDPVGFWVGTQLSVINEKDAAGNNVNGIDDHTIRTIIASDTAGTLTLDSPLPTSVIGESYEIRTELSAPIIGIHHLLGIPLNESLPPINLRLGTTRGTNALLTRTGAKTALVTTVGFKDLLEIGNQNRPKLFELNIQKTAPLITTSIEINERIDTHGNILQSIDRDQIRRQLAKLFSEGIESLAVCLLNSFVNPEHEQVIAEIANEIPFASVSISSRVSPLIKIIPRADTTVLDAYLNPVLNNYLEQLRADLHVDSNMRFLTSAGGLIPADQFSGKDSILSGPAGGVVGFSQAAKRAGYEQAIGFDMGGTSTDVSRFSRTYEYEYETEKSGVRIVTPMMAIETVAAGGGSICRFDGIKLTVGPASAGADPGPACYGKQGPLTVTDLNLIVGKLSSANFPIPLHKDAALAKLKELHSTIEVESYCNHDPIELAEGYLEIANTNMAQAIRTVSIARGYAPEQYLLVSFGGAGSQHACSIADSLGMKTILIHPDAGILSAVGIGHAEMTHQCQQGVYETLNDELLDDISCSIHELACQAIEAVKKADVSAHSIEVTVSSEIRFTGVEQAIVIPLDTYTATETLTDNLSANNLISLFHIRHKQRYGYTHPDKSLELATIRITARGKSSQPDMQSEKVAVVSVEPLASQRVRFAGHWIDTPLFRRVDLPLGAVVTGPAIISEAHCTTVVNPNWIATLLDQGELLLESQTNPDRSHIVPTTTNTDIEPDPIQLEIFNNHFAAIAKQMGITLQNTSSSVNVRERLDFSCAIFTSNGELVVNAPHIPVHLGAMGETVQAIIAEQLGNSAGIHAGDVFVTNDPYRGGSHLPDITVVTPVFNDDALLFFTASRAHHSEIGGITPGSMPPFSTTLAEEGVLIRSFKLLTAGQSHEDTLLHILGDHPFPSRTPEINLADIRAQVAANQQGVDDLQQLLDTTGQQHVLAYMQFIQSAAELKTRQAIEALADGVYGHTDFLDEHAAGHHEAQIKVTITVECDNITFDFAGTSDVLPSNLNANSAIVTAAVMYVMRCLINEDIPLNAGILKPVKILIPQCMLNPDDHEDPQQCPAIVGGNVETSQRIVDVLIGALSLAAGSQGTMNNLLFGDDNFGYYETICGGAGATADTAGASAVHTHMTNTRITDPEILERRYPVRLDEFSIRRDSGGKGKHAGGDGITRRITFLAPLTVSLLSSRRGEFTPAGKASGGNGKAGVNLLRRADGSEQLLAGCEQCSVEAGDQITIKTPGGGAWGDGVIEHGTEAD
jgi:5-oxoprolinase (ATP-hydrolysing)